MKKLEHIGIMVKNMEESIRFYTEVLGMELNRRSIVNEQLELVFLNFPGQESVEVELIGRWDESFVDSGIVNHLALTVENIEDELRRLKEYGVTLIDEEPRIVMNGVKIAFFFGPNGERLELFQRSN